MAFSVLSYTLLPNYFLKISETAPTKNDQSPSLKQKDRSSIITPIYIKIIIQRHLEKFPIDHTMKNIRD